MRMRLFCLVCKTHDDMIPTGRVDGLFIEYRCPRCGHVRWESSVKAIETCERAWA